MYKYFFKRFLDILISGIVLLCIGWFLILVAIILHFANKGAGVFFFQERPGKDERIFKLIKFKSMTDEKDEKGHLLSDRERLTKIGRFIRATSIDELPQLINVLKGDMSFVGPRPLLVRYLPYYTERERLRHTIRPGITGWSQINGRNALDWDSRFEMDVYYVEHVSLWFDMKILVLTVWKVINRDGDIPDKKENYFDIERLKKMNNNQYKF